MNIKLTVDRALRNYQQLSAAADAAFTSAKAGAESYRTKQAAADQAHRQYITLLKAA